MSPFQDPIEALFTRTKGQILPGLDRVALAYEILERPLNAIPTILVGGTNGKGTTCAFLSVLFKQIGMRTAFYSSPHLEHYSERVWIDGIHPTTADFATGLNHLRAKLPTSLYEQLSFFEILTLLAFVMIRDANADVAVVEVGMGGKWDATNICDPAISAVTGVALDHQQYLGHDLEAIALEKIGIARANRPFFWGRGGQIMSEPKVENVALEALKQLNCEIFERGSHFGFEDSHLWARQSKTSTVLTVEGDSHWPQFMRQNFSLAWSIATELFPDRIVEMARAIPSIHPNGVGWPRGQCGRYQKIEVNREAIQESLIVDVCHNVDGAKALLLALKSEIANPPPFPGLVSILSDKDFDEILDVLKTCLEPIVLFGCNSPRSWKSGDLSVRHQELAFHQTFLDAWKAMDRISPNKKKPMVVCGSVSAVGEVLGELNRLKANEPPGHR